MGIYSDGKVYGVKWVLYNEDNKDDYEILFTFEKTFTTPLNLHQIQEIEMEFQKLSEDEQKNLTISFYTCCTSTYDSGTYMTWFPGSVAAIVKLFLEGDIPI